jgi:hypothetical protein
LAAHEFFRGVDFRKVLALGYKPPFVPVVQNPEDTNNFDGQFTRQHITTDTFRRPYDTNDEKQDLFKGFSFEASSPRVATPRGGTAQF